jgi:hypothetical protein
MLLTGFDSTIDMYECWLLAASLDDRTVGPLLPSNRRDSRAFHALRTFRALLVHEILHIRRDRHRRTGHIRGAFRAGVVATRAAESDCAEWRARECSGKAQFAWGYTAVDTRTLPYIQGRSCTYEDTLVCSGRRTSIYEARVGGPVSTAVWIATHSTAIASMASRASDRCGYSLCCFKVSRIRRMAIRSLT